MIALIDTPQRATQRSRTPSDHSGPTHIAACPNSEPGHDVNEQSQEVGRVHGSFRNAGAERSEPVGRAKGRWRRRREGEARAR